MNARRRIAPTQLTRIDAPPRVSGTLRRACAPFAVIPQPAPGADGHTRTPDPHTLSRVQDASIVQIHGPSGAGKTALLRGIIASQPTRRTHIVAEQLSETQRATAVFDLLTGTARRRGMTLTLSGLGEPRLWARPAGVLSAGEQARLRLALSMHRARPGDLVVVDEFATMLDRVSAYALCRTVRRWALRAGVTLVVASAHEDLETMLDPDLLIDARTMRQRPARPPQPQPVTIEPGTPEDYRTLAHLHYRGGAPATMVRVLRALRAVPEHIDPTQRLLAGVLVVSMPALNSAWRERAWPGLFSTGNKARDARRLNDNLRTISRVIVDPRSRGLGVARVLVRAYLDDPLTPATEAIAAMGALCPFFQRAAMTPYTIVPDVHDTRLLDALHHLRITPETLAHTRPTHASLLHRELITWGRRRKLLPAGTPTPDQTRRLTPLAACRLCSRPRAFAYTKGEQDDEPDHTP